MRKWHKRAIRKERVTREKEERERSKRVKSLTLSWWGRVGVGAFVLGRGSEYLFGVYKMKREGAEDKVKSIVQ